MAAALGSAVGAALRRAAAASSPASSRLASAGAASANTRVRGIHRFGNYDTSRSMFDPEAYSLNPVPANPELDRADGFFTAAGCVGAMLFACLMGYSEISSRHPCDQQDAIKARFHVVE